MKNVKKIIEVKLMGLNELGVKELNDFYKDNILLGYIPEFKMGDINDIKIDDTEITNILGQYMNDYEPPTIAICKNICETIDKMNIRFVMSELKIPNFSRPFGGGKTRRAKSK